ncbi:12390_t:CDS:2, partial [Gigaspora rosea]
EHINLTEKTLQALRNEEVNGSALLQSSQKDLKEWGVPGGPAKNIMGLINKIKGEEQGHKTVTTLEDVIGIILKDAIPSPYKQSDRLNMPLKDRDFTESMAIIISNVSNNLKASTAKTDFHILVSGGAPGI